MSVNILRNIGMVFYDENSENSDVVNHWNISQIEAIVSTIYV